MPGVSRRRFLKGTAGAAGVASAGVLLAACDNEPSNSGPNTEPLTEAAVAFDGRGRPFWAQVFGSPA